MHQLLLALAVSQLADPAATQERILVLDLSASAVAVETAKALSEVFAQTIREAAPQAAVFSQADIVRALVVETQRDLAGCLDDVVCLAEIGGALGANTLAVGTVAKVGSVHLLTLKLIRPRDGSTERQLSQQLSGDEALLIEATRQLGANLIDPSRPIGYGFLEVLGEGQIQIDGKSAGKAPVGHARVDAGNHTILWQDGRKVEVGVLPFQTVRVEPLRPSAEAPPANEELVRLRAMVERLDAPVSARQGWYGSAGVGMGRASNPMQLKARGGVSYGFEGGYGFSNGWQLALSGSLFSGFTSANGGFVDREFIGVRLGHQSDYLITVSPSLSLGASHASVAGLAKVVDRDILTFQEGSTWGVSLGPSLTLRVGIGPYIDIGAVAELLAGPPMQAEGNGGANANSIVTGRLLFEIHSAQSRTGSVLDTPAWYWVVWSILGAGAGVATLLYEVLGNQDALVLGGASPGTATTDGNFDVQ